MNKNKLFQSVFIKCVSLVMLLPGFVTGAINSSVLTFVEVGEPLPGVALGLPQLGVDAELVDSERLSSAELSEMDNASLGQAMSRARREIRRPTDLQGDLEQNRDTHFFASNPSQNLGVKFTSNGARIESKFKGRDWQADFRLESRPPTSEVAANGTRIEYSYGSIIEWYDNRSDGIEHGFILKERPTDAGDDLALKIELTGLKARAGKLGSGALELVDAEGKTVLSYGKLKVWDAKGVELASYLSVQDNDIVITVADAVAQYPLTIDPLIVSQEQKLIASDAVTDQSFGCSVSVSGDSAIVGAPGDDDNGIYSGSAYIFVYSNGVWRQEQKLTADDGEVNEGFGSSVSLSGDRAIVGAHHDDDNGYHSGSAYIFVYSNGVWMQDQKLTPDDGSSFDEFGRSLSLSGDRALLGAYQDDENGNSSGSAYVFVCSNGVWTQEQKLKASDAVANHYFGWSVYLLGDRAIVGAYGDDDNGSVSGSAYIFGCSNGVWTQDQKLLASDGGERDLFGNSVSLSGDRALVGALRDSDNGSEAGSAYVFVCINGVWTQEQKLVASDGAASDLFGWSISLSGDRAVVGLDGRNGNGSAYVFVYSNGAWTQDQKLEASDSAVGDYFGYSVSISGDRVFVGACLNAVNGIRSGSAYVFVSSNGVWTQDQKLTAGDGSDGDRFGDSVSLSDDRVIVGVPYDDDNGSDSGSAFVFVYSNGVWMQEQKLVAGDGEVDDHFGWSVSLLGDRAIVGAPDDDANGTDSGSAYVFVCSNGVWMQKQKLVAGDGARGAEFGISVSLSGESSIVGARLDVGSGDYSGSAYVFEYSNGVWAEEQKLTDANGEGDDNFGLSVSMSEDTAIVGALQNRNDGVGYGSAYVYVRSNGVWRQDAKLKAGDGKAYDTFGRSVSLSGDRVIVSAFENDGNGIYYGSAYVFARSNGVWNQEAKLTADDVTSGGLFGNSVSLSGDRAIVGDHNDGANGHHFGSAYVFARIRGVWAQEKKLTADDSVEGAEFGFSVSISGDRAIVGAHYDIAAEIRSGSAYIYKVRERSVPNDYDGDGASDLAVLDQSTGRWFILTVAGNQLGFSINWGWPGVEGVAGDYDGDGLADLAVFDQGTGRWFVRALSGNTIVWENFWGWTGVRPVAGDYDGDGVYDLAILDQGTGRWFIKKTDNTILGWSLNWGWAGVEPVAGDYDGDGLADLAVFDQNTGRWFIRTVSGTQIAFDINWGWPGVDPVSGDYDGDGKDDLAIFDQATGRWFIRAVDGRQLAWDVNWGWPGVLPVSGDFNGDGADDLAIFDEATGRWFIRTLSGTTIAWDVNWGWPGVQPIGR